MGLRVQWKISCDHCGMAVEIEHRPENDVDKLSSYFDAWGPGIPDGWIQIPMDDITNKHYLFFHSEHCYKEWLRLQDRLKEIENLEKGYWIA